MLRAPPPRPKTTTPESAPHARVSSDDLVAKLDAEQVGPARGDAPIKECSYLAADRSAPHPRGCSVPETAAPLLRRVGPAPAGMLLCPSGTPRSA
ncbi:hypothetical protein CWI85_38065 [Streptomyces albidoflavus]|nr:hypothetical protein CWI85_38065 [Streptomyces albidoflavus]